MTSKVSLGKWEDVFTATTPSFPLRFMKFNNRILRRILIRDNRAESSIVALYKKLELQNAMEILDTVSGDISAAPSIVSL